MNCQASKGVGRGFEKITGGLKCLISIQVVFMSLGLSLSVPHFPMCKNIVCRDEYINYCEILRYYGNVGHLSMPVLHSAMCKLA